MPDVPDALLAVSHDAAGLPRVAVVAGVVAAHVPDALVAVLEDAEPEEDADDERDHQDHEQEAPHMLLFQRELAHRAGASPVDSSLGSGRL